MKNSFRVDDRHAYVELRRRDGAIYETVVDLADLETVQAFPNTWHATIDKDQRIYVIGNVKRKGVLMHRLLMGSPEGYEVDHVDGDGLNNRRMNLRKTDRSTNALNRQGANRNNSTGIRGIYWHRVSKRYRAQFRLDGKRREIGGFATPQEADQARRDYLLAARRKSA